MSILTKRDVSVQRAHELGSEEGRVAKEVVVVMVSWRLGKGEEFQQLNSVPFALNKLASTDL